MIKEVTTPYFKIQLFNISIFKQLFKNYYSQKSQNSKNKYSFSRLIFQGTLRYFCVQQQIIYLYNSHWSKADFVETAISRIYTTWKWS